MIWVHLGCPYPEGLSFASGILFSSRLAKGCSHADSDGGEHKEKYTNAFQGSFWVTFANIPLTESGHMLSHVFVGEVECIVGAHCRITWGHPCGPPQVLHSRCPCLILKSYIYVYCVYVCLTFFACFGTIKLSPFKNKVNK